METQSSKNRKCQNGGLLALLSIVGWWNRKASMVGWWLQSLCNLHVLTCITQAIPHHIQDPGVIHEISWQKLLI